MIKKFFLVMRAFDEFFAKKSGNFFQKDLFAKFHEENLYSNYCTKDSKEEEIRSLKMRVIKIIEKLLYLNFLRKMCFGI